MTKQDFVERIVNDFLNWKMEEANDSVPSKWLSIEVEITGELKTFKTRLEKNDLLGVLEGVVIKTTAKYGDQEPWYEEFDGVSFDYTVGFKTPKGWLSKKRLPIDVAEDELLELDKVLGLADYIVEDAKEFDPFWHEKEIQSRNAAGWAWVASRLTDERWG